jgi:hypothetical protein
MPYRVEALRLSQTPPEAAEELQAALTGWRGEGEAVNAIVQLRDHWVLVVWRSADSEAGGEGG